MDASVDFVMPKLGLTMVEGTVARWNTEPGRPFGPGDVLVVVETDKIAYEVEAPAAGIFREILVAEQRPSGEFARPSAQSAHLPIQ